MKSVFLSAGAAIFLATGVHAAVESADIVFIVDESGSMSGEQAFLEDVIPDLDIALGAAGVTTRNYAVVGFGSSTPAPRLVRGFGDASSTATNLDADLKTNGGTEDGYAGMKFALDNLNYTAQRKNFVLVTDEDRDVLSAYSSVNYASMLSDLIGAGAVLNAVVNNYVYDSLNNRALGVNDDGESYVADGFGGFVKAAGGTVSNTDSGNTRADYSEMAIATGGAVWDLNLLRQGGLTAESFASAFIDIKVEEIITPPDPDPNVIPLPASAWLLLVGFGGLTGLGRFRRAA